MNGKFLAAVAALALSAPVLADSGFYIQGDAGVSKVKASAEGASVSQSGFSPRLTAGYDFGNNWRVGVDYTHYKSLKVSETYDTETFNSKAKFNSVGVSAIHDFPVSEKVKPYLGARLGINRLSFDYQESDPEYDYYETGSFKKTKIGAGVLAGVGVNVTEKVTLDVGYRYNYWGKFDGTKVQSNELSAGVRVKF